LVEDSVDDALLLESAGYSVLEASRPAEVLQFAQSRESPIHLLITHVVMPEMTDPELAQRLAAMRPGLRMLFVSGYTEGVVVEQDRLGGQFLQKPFTTDALEEVREVLDRTARETR
jgi:FixJ family two-component response regulator